MVGALLALVLGAAAVEARAPHYLPFEADAAGGVTALSLEHLAGNFALFAGPRFARVEGTGGDFGGWAYSIGAAVTAGRAAVEGCTYACASFVTYGVGLRVGRIWKKDSEREHDEMWPAARAYVQLTPFYGHAWNDGAPLAPPTAAAIFGVRLGVGATLHLFTRAIYDFILERRSEGGGIYGWLMLPYGLLNHLELALELAAQPNGALHLGLTLIGGAGL
ncbi:MAG: hypothetical protein QM723_35510 [Myxococcaceae bacterium]